MKSADRAGETTIEMLAVSLVREYLSRKGYKDTLKMFDEESNGKDSSVHNRRILAEELHIVHIVKNNKEDGEPTFKTFIEIITKTLKEKTLKFDRLSWKGNLEESPISRSNHENTVNARYKNYNTPRHEYSELSKSFNITSDVIIAPRKSRSRNVFPKKSEQNQINLNIADSLSINSLSIESKSNSFIDLIKVKKQSRETGSSKPKVCPDESIHFNDNLEDLQIDECDDGGILDTSKVISSRPQYTSKSNITGDTAIELKQIIFGSSTQCFNKEWQEQGFIFNECPKLSYGLIQHKGGPCGLLASVQGYILKYLLFKGKKRLDKIPKLSKTQQQNALAHAITDIIQQASEGGSFTLTLPTGTFKLDAIRRFRPDNITEKLCLYSFSNVKSMKEFILSNLTYFQSSNGCILFLYSLVLTCGVENIRNSVDAVNDTLIGRHGYCTQELVNLMLTGKATSNVNDGTIFLDTGGTTKSTLRGVTRQTEIGYLSLFEHYQSCQVGDNYKNPLYPIWVVFSESHFSILFSLEFIHRNSELFELYYYDELGKQDEEIRLTVTLGSNTPIVEGDLTPPLELVIRTKWKDADINWNGVEPIL